MRFMRISFRSNMRQAMEIRLMRWKLWERYTDGFFLFYMRKSAA